MIKKRSRNIFYIGILMLVSFSLTIIVSIFLNDTFLFPGQKHKDKAEKIVESCNRAVSNKNRNTWDKLLCYAGEMEKTASKNGQKDAQRILLELKSIDTTAKNCHFIAHGIGRGVYKLNPSNMRDAIVSSSSLCNGGEQHGIIESYIESLPDDVLTKEQVAGICGKNPKSDCNRMVGHMLLVEAENNIEKAIDLCSGMSNDQQRFICYGGLMMERFIGFNLMDHGIIPRGDLTKKLPEFKKYCDSLQGDLKTACWQGLAHPAYYYYGRDSKKVLDFCNTAASQEAARECKTHSLSELVDVLRVDIRTAGSICRHDSSKDRAFEQECYKELVTLFLKPDLIQARQVMNVGAFCSTLPIAFQKECFVAMGRSLSYVLTPLSEVNEFLFSRG